MTVAVVDLAAGVVIATEMRTGIETVTVTERGTVIENGRGIETEIAAEIVAIGNETEAETVGIGTESESEMIETVTETDKIVVEIEARQFVGIDETEAVAGGELEAPR